MMGSVFFRHPSRYNIKLIAGYLIIATPAPTVKRIATVMITTVQRDLQIACHAKQQRDLYLERASLNGSLVSSTARQWIACGT